MVHVTLPFASTPHWITSLQLKLTSILVIPRVAGSIFDQLPCSKEGTHWARAGRDSFEVYSTRRQVFRYVQWFAEVFQINAMMALAEEIFAKFPEEVEERWK